LNLQLFPLSEPLAKESKTSVNKEGDNEK
jgi:hypothetical protein